MQFGQHADDSAVGRYLLVKHVTLVPYENLPEKSAVNMHDSASKMSRGESAVHVFLLGAAALRGRSRFAIFPQPGFPTEKDDSKCCRSIPFKMS